MQVLNCENPFGRDKNKFLWLQNALHRKPVRYTISDDLHHPICIRVHPRNWRSWTFLFEFDSGLLFRNRNFL